MGVLTTRVVASGTHPGRSITGESRRTSPVRSRGEPAAVRDGDAGKGHATPSGGQGWREPERNQAAIERAWRPR